ncbi:hypothetical protein SLEP1_g19581 [Rubroshorea leprosula]|uniref:RING-type E3 ubiquitin transferase n=1 Tax=Rubroshorea leprosula TaxID=152421 RepID=A0AAV5J393_9ROSI|nr:hypothetical protein SLEP1_g19581 [Rubroshorea leprosula]
MVIEQPKESPHGSNQSSPIERNQNAESFFSPRFKSIAAMAGWDEEALIVASLVVEDTPDRVGKHKKRSDLRLIKTPSTNSRRKRRVQRRCSVSTPPVAPLKLKLDEEDNSREESEKKEKEHKIVVNEEKKKTGGVEKSNDAPGVSCSNPALPCLDKLREELSCAICLEICYEPSTTPCGHSFCKKCLRSAADKCGNRCPKCRQLISNGRSCTINTVLWNTIQLLFPQDVESRKPTGGQQSDLQSPVRRTHSNRRARTRSSHPPMESGVDTRLRRRGAPTQDDEDTALAARLRREDDLSRLISRNTSSGRRGTPNQNADAALALRLQREEFMQSFRGNHEQSTAASLALARANLRAMASRAINIRTRGQ